MRPPARRAPAARAEALRRRCIALLPVLAASLAASLAGAVEIDRLDVRREAPGYRLEAESTLAAPPEFVFGVLLDCDNFHRLAAGITATRRLPDDGSGVPRCYTRIDACVWFFCRRIERVERVWSVPDREVITSAVPAASDFSSYVTRWELEPAGRGTRVRYLAVMAPDFWIPPVLGPWAVRRKLEATAREMGERIEYLYARGLGLADLPAGD